MPDTFHRALEVCDKQLFSKVHHLLKLERILHVTRCEVERSFCCISRDKTVFCSCVGEERLLPSLP